ncbi:hypothetical protein D0Z07_5534 [Hyphodiscus hymeniophilus]|uniref:Uncharacterized protein n=1 Tax=Hyphodiscus hymeniophilus TaxID=353542 RepID=A0A9P7AWD8_9HELO|nr:hypothetical protein D0Z07_5534 [Hyphodiscus hymeniophilus]
MKSIFTVPFLFSLTLASKPYLDPSIPIYLGEIFRPPTLTIIAWLPTTIINDLDWCMKATEAGPEKPFSLSGVDGLQIRDYFTEHAYLTREGKRFAECFITPESVMMGSCQAAKNGDWEGGHKYTGPGVRKWTCWINGRQWNRNVTDGRRTEVDGQLTSEYKPTGVGMRAATGSAILGTFTPVVTGS